MIVRFLILLCVISLGGQNLVASPISLKDLSKRIERFPENPPIDNEDPINPDFTNYLVSLKPNPWKRLIDIFKKDQSQELKEKLITDLKALGKQYAKKSQNTLTIPVNDKSRIWVMGDVHGAYFSLIRVFSELAKRGVINDKLEILDPNARFVFMGNIISRSPYIAETMRLVLAFCLKNPQQVIYMKGSHEHQENWRNYDTARNFRVRFNITDDEDILFTSMNDLFKALPEKVQLEHQTSKEIMLLNSLYGLDYLNQTKEEPRIKIFLNNQSRSRVYQNTRGLDMLPFESGLPTWTVFSCPSQSFQTMFNFYWDTVICIDPTTSWDSARAMALRHDVRSKSPAFEETWRHLMSGKVLKNGETYKAQWLDLTIGCPLDLSESSKVLGERLRAGIDLRVRQLNREGGINGKLLRVYFVNDHYSPSETVRITEDLVQRTGTNLILTTLGTSTTQALLPMVKDEKILLLFPYTGDDRFRQESLKYLINFRPSYMDEIYALTRYSVDTLKNQKIAVLHTDDIYGKQSLEYVQSILKTTYNLDADRVCSLPYPRGSVDIESAVPAFKECGADALILLSTFDAGRVFVQKLGVNNLKNTNLLGFSYLTDLFRDFVGPDSDGTGLGLNFAITRVIPDPNNSPVDIIKEYRKELAYIYPGARTDVDSLEGYINTSILIDIITKIPEPVTLDKIVQTAEGLATYPFKGLTLDFKSTTRELSHKIWIDTGKGHWIETNSHSPAQPTAH